MWTGAKYGITRDLDFIGAYYHYIQNQFVIGSSAVTCANNGGQPTHRCYGWYDTYSVVLDWRFLPKWDTYIGVDVLGGVWRSRLRRYYHATTLPPPQACASGSNKAASGLCKIVMTILCKVPHLLYCRFECLPGSGYLETRRAR